MILVYLIQSIAFIFQQVSISSCKETEYSTDEESVILKNNVIPNNYLDNVKAVGLSIDLLHKQTEDRLGIYFKICDLFCQIAE